MLEFIQDVLAVAADSNAEAVSGIGGDLTISALPHHPAYGSVPGDSADQAESDPREQKTE